MSSNQDRELGWGSPNFEQQPTKSIDDDDDDYDDDDDDYYDNDDDDVCWSYMPISVPVIYFFCL